MTSEEANSTKIILTNQKMERIKIANQNMKEIHRVEVKGGKRVQVTTAGK